MILRPYCPALLHMMHIVSVFSSNSQRQSESVSCGVGLPVFLYRNNTFKSKNVLFLLCQYYFKTVILFLMFMV